MNKLEWLCDLLVKQMVNKEYGKVIVNLEAGNIVNVETRKSLKPPVDFLNKKN